jgi:hypothetical protein
MADRIVTAGKADRTPNWDKWRLIPDPMLWQCVLLSLNIDPDTVRDNPYQLEGSFDRIFKEKKVKDRMDVASANLYKALQPTHHSVIREAANVSLRQFAAWVREIGWDAPAELLAMADDHNRTPSDRRTSGATATREARKAGRLGDLKRFIEDVCKALDKDGHEIRESGGRKRLPLSAEDLHTLFCARHPEHQVAQSTFDDLGTIVTLKPGPKRYEINQLAEMLA